MGEQTRIGTAALVESRGGSIVLPPEVTLYCPRCNEKVADKGNCLVSFQTEFDPEKGFFVLRLAVDCRVCNFNGTEPATAPWLNT